MFTPTLSSLTEPAKGVLEPIRKLNQQAVVNMGRLAAGQIDSLKLYSDLGIGQLKAAAAVRDLEGLQALLSQQRDVLRKATDRLVADARAFVEMGMASLSKVKKPNAEATVREKIEESNNPPNLR